MKTILISPLENVSMSYSSPVAQAGYLAMSAYNRFLYRACKSRARKRGWGQLGAGGPYTPC